MQNRKTVLVTGGTRGIGKIIAEHFLVLDYNVIVCSSNQNSCARAKKEFLKYKNRVLVMQADVSIENDVVQLIEQALSKFNKVDILVNNAGVYTPIGKVFENNSNDWKRTIEINLIGPFYTCKYLIPEMIKNDFGRIINLSGGGATKPMPQYSAYSAAKAGLVRLTETIAEELDEFNITVNAIAPGFIATDIHKGTIEATEELAGEFYHQTLHKLSEGGDDPKLTAKLSEHLASDKCRITGKLISAIYDDWQNLYNSADIDNDLYTLRRIDDIFVKVVK